MTGSRWGAAVLVWAAAGVLSAQTLHYRPPAVDPTPLPAAVSSASPAPAVASAALHPFTPLHALARPAVRPAAAALVAAPAPAPAPVARGPETLHIIVGQSMILRGTMMRRIYVANPAVLQTFNSAPDELVVTAKQSGATSLIIWDTAGRTQMYNVSADFDPMSLRAALDSELPGNHIEVHGGQDLLTLTGTVPNKEMIEEAGKLAQVYSKNVANSIRVAGHGKEVELKLQIMEVDRTKAEQFGINLFNPQGNNVGAIGTGMFPSTATVTQSTAGGQSLVSVSDPLNFWVYNFAHGIGASVEDLEQKNVLQILAEPTLTTMSGEEAKFLSGGEFPFPVVQGGAAGTAATVTIQFRPFGVKMDFTPVVNDDGTIRVKVAPEVSSLDYSNAVTISGFTVPALSTRRAETEVELHDGQSFAISGLLDHRTTENLSKVPGIGDIPILGQLFRSKNLSHSVVELVVVVRARVIDPSAEPAPHQPTWSVPNMTEQQFDKALHKERPKDVPTEPQPQPIQYQTQPEEAR